MLFNQLKYFVVTAEELNITRAAQKLFLSQQALSEQISKLEKRYGVSFFTRKRGLQLTHEGIQMYAFCKNVLALERQLHSQFFDLDNDLHGELHVGMSYSRSHRFFPIVMESFHKQYPNISVRITCGNSEELKKAVISRELDLVIGYNQFFSMDIETLKMGTEHLCLVISKNLLNSLFPKNTDKIIDMLRKEPDIGILENAPFLLLEKQNYIYPLIESLFFNRNIKPNVVFQTDDNELLAYMASKDLGAAFIPHFLLSTMPELFMNNDSNPLLIFPLGGQEFSLPLVIGYHRKNYLSNVSKYFINTLMKEYQKLKILTPDQA